MSLWTQVILDTEDGEVYLQLDATGKDDAEAKLDNVHKVLKKLGVTIEWRKGKDSDEKLFANDDTLLDNMPEFDGVLQ